MGLKTALIAFFTFFTSGMLTGQCDILLPEYFRLPVDYNYKLAGNFCEIRESHFHAGIDIKPSFRAAFDKIYSIGDGNISRIRVSSGGYGKVIYIDHPESGYTSVYAHLHTFNDAVNRYIQEMQMTQENYEVDILLDPELFKIKKGDVIGLMGNTGHSSGAHLHFEIRDTKTEMPVNPFLFGMHVYDTSPPSLISLALHGLDADFHKISDTRVSLKFAQNNVVDLEDPIIIASENIGIALQVYDKTNGSHNKLSIYGLHLYVDDSLTYSYHINNFSFDQYRQIGGFIDFESFKKERKTYLLAYKYPGSQMEFTSKNTSGLFNIFTNRDRKVRIVVEDFCRNKKTINFIVRQDNNLQKQDVSKDINKVNVGEFKEMTHDNLVIKFKNNSLFRNVPLEILSIKSEENETKYQIHNELEPIKTPIDIEIKPEVYAEGSIRKAIIVNRKRNGSKINYGGVWNNGKLCTKIREFGTYYLAYDTIAPVIKSINFKADAANKSSFRFKLSENISVRGELARPLQYKVWINDIFMVSPFDMKTGILTVPISDLPKGKYDLRIHVIDHSDNQSTYTGVFFK